MLGPEWVTRSCVFSPFDLPGLRAARARRRAAAWMASFVIASLLAPAFSHADEASPSVSAQPKLEVESFSIDLGRISDDDSAQAVFILHNRGQAELRILKAKPS